MRADGVSLAAAETQYGRWDSVSTECPQFPLFPKPCDALLRRSPRRQEAAGLQCYLGSGAAIAPSAASNRFYFPYLFHVPWRQLQLKGLQANAVPFRALMDLRLQGLAVWQYCRHGLSEALSVRRQMRNCLHKAIQQDKA